MSAILLNMSNKKQRVDTLYSRLGGKVPKCVISKIFTLSNVIEKWDERMSGDSNGFCSVYVDEGDSPSQWAVEVTQYHSGGKSERRIRNSGFSAENEAKKLAEKYGFSVRFGDNLADNGVEITI